MHDSRKHPRFEENVTITFEDATDIDNVGQGMDEVPCWLTDISEGGARIRVNRYIPAGTPLLLHLVLEHEDEEEDDCYLQLHAVTRWHESADSDPPFDIGLEFQELQEDDRAALADYIAKRLTRVS